ncbi:unnamed protein product, partial [Ectocarpus sp. 12 AP-2014]
RREGRPAGRHAGGRGGAGDADAGQIPPSRDRGGGGAGGVHGVPRGFRPADPGGRADTAGEGGRGARPGRPDGAVRDRGCYQRRHLCSGGRDDTSGGRERGQGAAGQPAVGPVGAFPERADDGRLPRVQDLPPTNPGAAARHAGGGRHVGRTLRGGLAQGG